MVCLLLALLYFAGRLTWVRKARQSRHGSTRGIAALILALSDESDGIGDAQGEVASVLERSCGLSVEAVSDLFDGCNVAALGCLNQLVGDLAQARQTIRALFVEGEIERVAEAFFRPRATRPAAHIKTPKPLRGLHCWLGILVLTVAGNQARAVALGSHGHGHTAALGWLLIAANSSSLLIA